MATLKSSKISQTQNTIFPYAECKLKKEENCHSYTGKPCLRKKNKMGREAKD